MSLKEHFNQKPIYEWDNVSIIRRTSDSIMHFSKFLEDEINFYVFVQYLFFEQWHNLKKYANSKNVLIIGDIPMYPSPDSSDIWVNPKVFKVNSNIKPIWIAGVPPDYYSEEYFVFKKFDISFSTSEILSFLFDTKSLDSKYLFNSSLSSNFGGHTHLKSFTLSQIFFASLLKNTKSSINLFSPIFLFYFFYKYLNICSGYKTNSLFLNLSISIHIASVSELSSITLYFSW